MSNEISIYTGKYTPPRINALLVAAKKGWTKKMVANAGGVSVNTLSRWLDEGALELEQGLADDPSYSPPTHSKGWFYLKYETGQSGVDALAIARIKDEFTREGGMWQAAAWWLQRRHPEEFGKRVEQRVVGHDGGVVKIATVEVIRAERPNLQIIEGDAEVIDDD